MPWYDTFYKDGELTGVGAALAGGIGGLLGVAGGSGQSQGSQGYTGGIPEYTAQRSLVPNAFDSTGRRPGEAGRSYFTNVQYTSPGMNAAGTPRVMGQEYLDKLNADALAAQQQQTMINEALLKSFFGAEAAKTAASTTPTTPTEPYFDPATGNKIVPRDEGLPALTLTPYKEGFEPPQTISGGVIPGSGTDMYEPAYNTLNQILAGVNTLPEQIEIFDRFNIDDTTAAKYLGIPVSDLVTARENIENKRIADEARAEKAKTDAFNAKYPEAGADIKPYISPLTGKPLINEDGAWRGTDDKYYRGTPPKTTTATAAITAPKTTTPAATTPPKTTTPAATTPPPPAPVVISDPPPPPPAAKPEAPPKTTTPTGPTDTEIRTAVKGIKEQYGTTPAGYERLIKAMTNYGISPDRLAGIIGVPAETVSKYVDDYYNKTGVFAPTPTKPPTPAPVVISDPPPPPPAAKPEAPPKTTTPAATTPPKTTTPAATTPPPKPVTPPPKPVTPPPPAPTTPVAKPVTPPPPPAPTTTTTTPAPSAGIGGVSDADIVSAVSKIQSAYGNTPEGYERLVKAMKNYGISPERLAEVTGMPLANVQRVYNKYYAKGGIASLSRGYYLGGATDGMADKVPATIDGREPARLSDGEFVIPADVVSHLGNGNSDAGARNLYSMMDRVRKARTGTTRQGRQINPQKYLA